MLNDEFLSPLPNLEPLLVVCRSWVVRRSILAIRGSKSCSEIGTLFVDVWVSVPCGTVVVLCQVAKAFVVRIQGARNLTVLRVFSLDLSTP